MPDPQEQESDNQIDPSAPAEGAQKEATSEGGPGDGGKVASNGPTLESMQAELDRLRSERDTAVMRLLDPELQEFREAKRNGGKREAEEPVRKDPLAELDDERLNAMTNRQLIETAVTAIMSKFEQDILPRVESRLESVADTVEDVKAKREVTEAASRHKDFWEYKVQMIQLSNQPQYAHLGAEDIYYLAKARTSKPAAPAKETAKADPAAVAAARANSERPNAGSAGGGAKGAKELTAEEAGDLAWEQVFGKRK